MKVDCQWFSANLESFFGESLGVDELHHAMEHLKSCHSCRNEVQALREVDPLMKQVMQYRMTKARNAAVAPRRGFGFQIGLAGTAVVIAATLIFGVFLRQPGSTEKILPVVTPAVQNAESIETKDVKGDSSVPDLRAKPGAPDQIAPVKQDSPEPPIPAGAPDFAVIDPSGYPTNLQDYRGHVLLFGVWNTDQPETALSLQRLYQAFGTRQELRILGVSRRSQNRLPGTTFPMVFNNGSRLFETRNADYVIVDKEGHVQMRGSLAGDSSVLIPQIRAKLDQLGGR